ncbi:hypothetical protein PMAYCL1PPCAC_12064 [Pristionchus mayeri]|uniref:Transcription initiation factor TFIID subunit 12 n=1 Tax=Pristionchus mayeri TaxID=1317129 RepID=A0AAN5CFW5_9BILA|nr:hypothetical protein PMAYCL1PPCAC_12064 [Pristionchus mayeri]
MFLACFRTDSWSDTISALHSTIFWAKSKIMIENCVNVIVTMNNQPPPAGGFGQPSGSQGFPQQQFLPGKPQFQPGQVKMEYTSPPHHPQPQVKMEYNPSNVKMEMQEVSYAPSHGGGGPPHGAHGGAGGGPSHGPPGPHHGVSPGGPMRMGMSHPPHGRPGPYPPMAGRPPPHMMQQQMMNRPGMGGPPLSSSSGSHGPPGMGGPSPGGPPMDRPAPPSVTHQAPPPPPGVNQPVLVQMNQVNEGVLIDKNKLEDLAREVEPTIVLEEPVKDALLEYTEEFVDELVERVCRLATHRNNNRLEARDVELVLEQVFNMPRVPRSSAIMANPMGSSNPNEKNPGVVAHNQRVALIKKTLKKI